MADHVLWCSKKKGSTDPLATESTSRPRREAMLCAGYAPPRGANICPKGVNIYDGNVLAAPACSPPPPAATPEWQLSLSLAQLAGRDLSRMRRTGGTEKCRNGQLQKTASTRPTRKG